MPHGRHSGLLVVSLFVVTACSPDSETLSATTKRDTPARHEVTSVFDCAVDNEAITFVVRTIGADLALWLPPDFDQPYLVLEQVPAASGARYETGDVTVWLHGQEAILTVAGNSYKSCQRDAYASVWEHAKLDGVDFRATGNEPGWILEIRNRSSLLLDYDYGDSRIETEMSEAVEDHARQSTYYSADAKGQTVTIEISATECTDSMSGFEFESTVTVNIGERSLHGCGRALQ
jgi:uncharacterized membrane protein